MARTLLDELTDWLRIPSISTGGGAPADLEAAAAWAADHVRRAGGEADLVRDGDRPPLVVGELRAASKDAPTILIYGHYDVQGAEPLELWDTPPFEPAVRDGRLYARGAADDKGNFLPLLLAACELAAAGELAVNVRVLVEGEEETGSAACMRWLDADARGADAAIVFDSAMVDERTPAITIGLRGIVQLDVSVRVGARDLHSGIYGGAVHNALHVLHGMLGAVMPGPGGELREELQAGVEPPAAAELESWKRLPPGERVLAGAGALELCPGAAGEYYLRTGARPSLDVNTIAGGATRTVVPAVATATLSMRLAPRQGADEMRATLERLLRAAAPDGVEVQISAHAGDPAFFDVDEPAIRLAAAALERACGVAPAFVRIGGSIPIVAQLAAKGIPTIVSGFVLPEDAFHAPNESFSLRSLELAARSGRELLVELAGLRTFQPEGTRR
jgi:acetylornithine deacetylase/succinyl-diaminopimelate desuccinylase-like protein